MNESVKDLLSQAYDELGKSLGDISDIERYERILKLLMKIDKELYNQI